MNFLEQFAEKWNAVCAKVGPVLSAIVGFFRKFADILMMIWGYIVKLRKIFLAIPVVLASIKLAQMNLERLPETVGLNLQIDGTFEILITRDQACWGPVLITLICLVLMFCSKRVLTPWVVSVITLILPVFILVINTFPS